MSNDAFLGVAGSGKNLTTEEAEWLDAKQQQHQIIAEWIIAIVSREHGLFEFIPNLCSLPCVRHGARCWR